MLLLGRHPLYEMSQWLVVEEQSKIQGRLVKSAIPESNP